MCAKDDENFLSKTTTILLLGLVKACPTQYMKMQFCISDFSKGSISISETHHTLRKVPHNFHNLIMYMAIKLSK
jgi:hypothetical protein